MSVCGAGGAQSVSMCVSVSLRVLLLASCLCLVLAQDSYHQNSIVPGFLSRRECGRKGLCPYVRRLIPHLYGGSYGRSHEPPSLCGNLCASDHSCPGLQKCCPTNCGYACFDPVFVVEH